MIRCSKENIQAHYTSLSNKLSGYICLHLLYDLINLTCTLRKKKGAKAVTVVLPYLFKRCMFVPLDTNMYTLGTNMYLYGTNTKILGTKMYLLK